ncbi:MAG: antitoxin Xre/MbcA/ParS toxin-binding domain-containing protein [Spirosomataceae bacterium]
MIKIPHKIVRGGASVLNRYAANLSDDISLVLSARHGLKASAFFDLVLVTGYEKERLASFFNLSLKTFQRYEQEDKKLDPASSELTLKLMALFKKGEEVFGSTDATRRWLEKPAYGLGNQLPVDFLCTTGGIDLVMDELIRIEYGDLA